MKKIYLDTETMGFYGFPFLIQYQINEEDPILFHVFEHAPQESIKLIESFCQPEIEIVAYNAVFDIKMLSKLATVATQANSWSFDAIWEAERIWRHETSYTERLDHLQLMYPEKVTDLMIAAQSLPPLEEQFMVPPRLEFWNFPIAAVPELEKVMCKALASRPFYHPGHSQIDLASRLRLKIDNTHTKKERERVRRIQRSEDYTELSRTVLYFDSDGIYTLKNVARVLDYPGPIATFDFLDNFGRIPESPCPTYRDRHLYERLYQYVIDHQHDSDFIAYAKNDIRMLLHLDRHYRGQPQFTALQHNHDLIAIVANLELYGVHVDPAGIQQSRTFYEQRVQESAAYLKKEGLDNYNSSSQVIRFVNRLLKENLTVHQLEEIDRIEDMRQDTLEELLDQVEKRSLPANKQIEQALNHLLRARLFSKRSQFFEPVVGDTLYPQFRIRGTVSDRMITRRPTIQNMPARAQGEEKEEFIQFRAPFTPPAGYLMLVGDADQFEMRLVAAEARESSLIEAFNQGIDPHSLTALKALGPQIRRENQSLAHLEEDQLLHLLNQKDPQVKHFRSRGKILNFATIYGATKYGIARQAEVTHNEADAMLAAFFAGYPAIQQLIQQTHALIAVAQKTNIPGNNVRTPPSSTRVANRLGVTRSFELALRLIDILLKLCEDGQIDNYLPEVAAIRQRCIPYKEGMWTPPSVVRSQLSSAAQKLQTICQRQAFNFKIQSLGAAYIKQLQARIPHELIAVGLHTANTLTVLPGINVHDELHFYVKEESTVDSLHRITRQVTSEISQELEVPIVFQFSQVQNWADKS